MIAQGNGSRTTGGGSRRALAALTAGAVLACTLAACAPEPGESLVGPGKDGSSEVEKLTEEDIAEREAVPDASYEKQTELPDGFPAGFPIPEGAVVDDAGEREDSWFVVLGADDQATADRYWDAVVSDGGFAVADLEESEVGDRSATLVSDEFECTAVLMVADDGLLLSYDIMKDL